MSEHIPDGLMEVAARALKAALEDEPANGRTDAEIDRDAARAVLAAASKAGWVEARELDAALEQVDMSTSEAVEARAQAERLAEALDFVAALLDANHLTIGASHGQDACGLCGAQVTAEAALRAFRGPSS